MRAQHALQAHRATPAFGTCLGIERFDHRAQLRPRHDLVHLGQEHVASRGLAMGFKSTVGLCRQGQLIGHRLHSLGQVHASTAKQNQSFPSAGLRKRFSKQRLVELKSQSDADLRHAQPVAEN